MALLFWLSFLFSDLQLCFCSSIIFFTACTPPLIYIHPAEMKMTSATRRKWESFLQGRLFSCPLDRISCSSVLKQKARVSSNPLCLVQENAVFHFHPWQIWVSTAGEMSMGSEQSWPCENTSKFIPTPQTLQQKNKSHFPNLAKQQSCCWWTRREMKGVSSAQLCLRTFQSGTIN